jgi:hypothetical protein
MVMNPALRFLFWCGVATLSLAALGCEGATKTASTPAERPVQEVTDAGGPRVVAIGDLHGDLDATLAALKLAGAIDDEARWVGGALVVVQIGDQLSRGDDEPEILALLDRLSVEARTSGGAVIALNGNHELLNAAGDFRYATPEGLTDFGGAEGRRQAFAPGSANAKRFADRPLFENRGGTVFVHAGIFPEHLELGLDVMERELDAWLRGESAAPPVLLTDSDSPVWTRRLGKTPSEADCEAVKTVLGRLGARRMVIGHTPQPHINAACGDLVWRVDVGLSQHYGGPIEVLAIDGDVLTTLSAPRPK